MRWVNGEMKARTLASFPVPDCICPDSGRLVIASFTIERIVTGTLQISRYNITTLPGMPPEDVHLINQVNSMTQWEENAHKNAALRWLRDHRQTGYGIACSDSSARIKAMWMAFSLAGRYERMLVTGWGAENKAIDTISPVLHIMVTLQQKIEKWWSTQ